MHGVGCPFREHVAEQMLELRRLRRRPWAGRCQPRFPRVVVPLLDLRFRGLAYLNCEAKF